MAPYLTGGFARTEFNGYWKLDQSWTTLTSSDFAIKCKGKTQRSWRVRTLPHQWILPCAANRSSSEAATSRSACTDG